MPEGEHISVVVNLQKHSWATARLTERNILDVTYGYEIKDDHDELLNLALHVADEAGQNSTPGARLVEAIPWCKGPCFFSALYADIKQVAYLPSWVPGAGFKKEAMVMRGRWLDFVNRPYEYTRDQIVCDGILRCTAREKKLSYSCFSLPKLQDLLSSLEILKTRNLHRKKKPL
jgi:hypothetical protein